MDKFILSLFSKEDKLKASTLFQVLTGKRTSSVLAYAFFHDLLPFLGSFPNLTEKQFYQQLSSLQMSGLLYQDEEGLLYVKQTSQSLPVAVDRIDFFRFGRKAMENWRLLQFLIQVASFMGKQTAYLPLESSPFYTERVRGFVKDHRTELSETIYQELSLIFGQLDTEQANFLARTLTGYQQNGAAFFQLLRAEEQQEPYATLKTANILHAFFHELHQHKGFLLYRFLKPLLMQNVNTSMLQTRHLVEQGMTMAEIQRYRQLKAGTIQDHLIEWALLDVDFPFTLFFEHPKELAALPEASWQYRYKELIEGSAMNFLEVRLYQIWQRRQAC